MRQPYHGYKKKLIWGFEEALAKPNKVKELKITYIDRYNTSDWEQLKQFPNLRDLTLSNQDNSTNVVDFPSVVFELTELE
jgi:hypothetical protein